MNKLHLHAGTLLSNKRREWPVNRQFHRWMWKYYAEWKPDQTEKPCIERVHCTSLENVNYSDRRWISGCLGMGLEGEGAWVIKAREDILGVMDMFIILRSWCLECTCVKTHRFTSNCMSVIAPQSCKKKKKNENISVMVTWERQRDK